MTAQIINFPIKQQSAPVSAPIDNKPRIQAAYSYLTPIAEGGTAIKNIRIELKRNFPGCKFSVTQRDYTCINIRWTDGPTTGQVEAIINKYSAGHFDGMTDCYEYSRDDFNKVFGDCKYIFTHRDNSISAIEAAISTIAERYRGNLGEDFTATAEDFNSGKLWNVSMNMGGNAYDCNVQQYVHRLLSRTPAQGFEPEPQVTEEDGACCIRYFNHQYGQWDMETGASQAECWDQIEWRKFNY